MPHDRPVLDHFRRDGAPKMAFASKQEALIVRRRIEDYDFFERQVFMPAIDVYECPTCGQWHVGNMRKSRPRNQRRLAEARGQ